MGHLVGNQGMSYTISNLTKVAIWSLKSFRIHPHLAEKSTTLLFHGTFGHPVLPLNEDGGTSQSETTQPNSQIISNILHLAPRRAYNIIL